MDAKNNNLCVWYILIFFGTFSLKISRRGVIKFYKTICFKETEYEGNLKSHAELVSFLTGSEPRYMDGW